MIAILRIMIRRMKQQIYPQEYRNGTDNVNVSKGNYDSIFL